MKWRTVALILAVAGVLAVWVLCLVPAPHGSSFQYKDKVQHLAAYLAQTLWLAALFPRRRPLVGAGFLLQGAVIEGLQSLTGYRSAEVADMVANSLGVGLGLLLVHTRPGALLSRWLSPRATPGI